MVRSVENTTKHLRAWTIRTERGKAKTLMDKILAGNRLTNTQVLVAKADMVFGMDHLRSALYHADRAIEDGTNSSDSLAMETLLYASGERQLSTAIKKMSVSDQTEELVVAQLAGGPLEPDETWRELGYATGLTADRLMRFGVTKMELSTIGERSPLELVLEMVAAVDILKK
jgi:tRNA threonylcarbamoyladenosine modification (KEOPS) complex Cgi121 subunit